MEQKAEPSCQNYNSSKMTATLINFEGVLHQQINVLLSPSTSRG